MMRNKIRQSGFIQIPISIAIAIGIAVTGGVGATFIEYKDVSNKIAQSDKLSSEENYNTAIETLELAKNSWLVTTFGIKSEVIKNDLSELETRQQHQAIYQKASNQLDKKELEEAITSFSEIPEDSFYYQRAQLKTEESKRGIVEGKLEKEQVARGLAEQKTKQEIQARKITENKTIEEAFKRVTAEQVATNERLAKEQQQRETTAQKAMSEQREVQRIKEEKQKAELLTKQKSVSSFYQDINSAITQRKNTIQDYINEVLACIEKAYASGTAKYDAEITKYDSEISQWEWHLANLCDEGTECPSGRYRARNIDYIEQKISNAKYWRTYTIGQKLQVRSLAQSLCGINNGEDYQSISDSLTRSLERKSFQYKSPTKYESYTIQPNGVGGYSIYDSQSKTWTVSPNSFGGVQISDPNLSTWQLRPNGVGGYDIAPF